MKTAADSLYVLPMQLVREPRTPAKPKVCLGRLCIIPTIANTLPAADILAALAKHVSGDWGDLPPREFAANQRALRRGDPVCSLHVCSRGKRLWIATETDRAVTTVMLADG